MLHSAGQWGGAGPGWCGTGARRITLLPGEHATFRVYLATNQDWKVGIRYYTPTIYDRLPQFVRAWLNRFGYPRVSPRTPLLAWSAAIQYDPTP